MAQQYFADVGADVELVTLFFGGHSECAVPALLAGKTWLDKLADLPLRLDHPGAREGSPQFRNALIGIIALAFRG